MVKNLIAGKTESEILLMGYWIRCQWYKTILPEEKEVAMKIIEMARQIKMSILQAERMRDPENRLKISKALMGEKNPNFGGSPSRKTRNKMSMAKIKHWKDPEYKAKQSVAMIGENNPNFGQSPSDERRAKQRASWTPEMRTEMSISMSGENHWNWQNGKSFEPYCILFDFKKKEEIRNKYGRTCIICGKSTLQNVSKDKTYWFGRLDIDHVDENKMQGCNDWEWRLVPLCRVCHAKMQNNQNHLLLQLLLINNKLEQINLEINE